MRRTVQGPCAGNWKLDRYFLGGFLRSERPRDCDVLLQLLMWVEEECKVAVWADWTGVLVGIGLGLGIVAD